MAQDHRLRMAAGDIADAAVRGRAMEGADIVFHLAGVLSAFAEQDYALSRRVNLDATLALFEAAGAGTRIVYASSIAVFGAPLPAHVDDRTPPEPALIYAAHKRMCEIALADFARRGAFEGIALRLPGIVARPRGAASTRSAFLSDIFHALRRRETFTSPVSPLSTFWIMSVECCVDNLVHAARLPLSAAATGPALTLPALRLSMAELVAAVARACGVDAASVSYAPDPETEAVFGGYPPLATPLAEKLGFRSDGTADDLVRRVLATR
jgi:nucleoside-diphosphate-sugar epimerase